MWGSLDPKTLELLELLSQIYTKEGHYREAMGVHEEVLRLVVEGDDGDDRTLDTMIPETARRHVELLKASFQRLGKWDKSEALYKDLFHTLVNMEEYKTHPSFKDLQPIEKWSTKEKPHDNFGIFIAPKSWELDINASAESYGSEHEYHDHNGSFHGTSTYTNAANGAITGGVGGGIRTVSGVNAGGHEGKKRPGLKYRATSNWGMGLINRFLHGEQEEREKVTV